MRMEKLLPLTWTKPTYLMSISQLLAKNWPTNCQIPTCMTHSNVHVSTIAPCVMNINLSYEGIVSSMAKLKADKAAGPDSVAPKL